MTKRGQAGLSVIATAIIVVIIVVAIALFWNFFLKDYISQYFGPEEQELFGNFIKPPNIGEIIKALPSRKDKFELSWPLPDEKIYFLSSCFGRRQPSKIDASKCHPGIDIPANAGTTVYAAYAGTVIREGSECVRIKSTTPDAGKTFYTRYCHVNALAGENAQVNPLGKGGPPLGTVKKDHLHFEVLSMIKTPTDTGWWCTPGDGNQTKNFAFIVYANPPQPVKGLGTFTEAKGTPHLNPFCFFPKSIQEKIQYRERDISCLSDTGGIAKGCSEYGI